MDNEIIIDGVNVEDCSYYNKDNYPYCCEVWDNECEAQNCYYKQFQRLQQENTDFKKYIERMDKPVIEAVDADIALENAELKAELDTYKKIWNDKEVQIALTDVRTGERKLWYENCLKYKSCLQEIKKIIIQEKVTNNKKLRAILDLITKAEEE